jgi:predicted transcriptional regulator
MDKELHKTLEQIKWLLVFQLQNQGVSSKDIAKVLGVDPAIISRRVPRRKKTAKDEEA